MSIFRRESSPSPAAAAGSSEANAAQKRRLTHVAAGTRIRGEVTGPTELLIEGEIEGEIRLDAAVTIGAEGAVRGPVSASIVRVGGKVAGNVIAADRVEVAASGSVEGDISAPRIIIGEGAFFKGRVEMRGEEARHEPQPEGSKGPQGFQG
jgi:cytoskeletal protein CcmA (bactofilin family)